jgi:hypothetical protein
MTSGGGDYKMYRVLTDLMGHEKIGRNTIYLSTDFGAALKYRYACKMENGTINNDFQFNFPLPGWCGM